MMYFVPPKAVVDEHLSELGCFSKLFLSGLYRYLGIGRHDVSDHGVAVGVDKVLLHGDFIGVVISNS